MNTFPLVLALDVSGTPGRWINYEQSAYYYSKDRVAWSMSPVEITLRGGINAKTGLQSTLTMNTIIAIRGQISAKRNYKMHVPPLTNRALFRRDRNICAYCAMEYPSSMLTRDHVTPKSQGGVDKWTNVVAACGNCNKRKDSRTPEQANMTIAYVPYAPVREEWLILQNKNILFDQMQYLIKRVPLHSRLHNN